MTVCVKCHRPLKAPTPTGMGSTCARKAKAVAPAAHERDLFGYSIDAAVSAALGRLQVHIESMAAEAHMEVRKGFHRARVLLLGWAP